MRTKIDIRRAIKERGYTIASFCRESGLKSQNIIQNYIQGNPSLKKLEELCEKLNCDITDLFFPIDEAEAPENKESMFQEERTEEEVNTQDDTAQPAVATTAFCPHCWARVRVVVVLLPEP